MLINGKKCPILVRGLAGGYRFTKTREGHLRPVPDKNGIFSHVQDCLQYVCLVAQGGMMDVIARHLRPRSSAKRPRVSSGGWT